MDIAILILAAVLALLSWACSGSVRTCAARPRLLVAETGVGCRLRME